MVRARRTQAGALGPGADGRLRRVETGPGLREGACDWRNWFRDLSARLEIWVNHQPPWGSY